MTGQEIPHDNFAMNDNIFTFFALVVEKFLYITFYLLFLSSVTTLFVNVTSTKPAV